MTHGKRQSTRSNEITLATRGDGEPPGRRLRLVKQEAVSIVHVTVHSPRLLNNWRQIARA